MPAVGVLQEPVQVGFLDKLINHGCFLFVGRNEILRLSANIRVVLAAKGETDG